MLHFGKSGSDFNKFQIVTKKTYRPKLLLILNSLNLNMLKSTIPSNLAMRTETNEKNSLEQPKTTEDSVFEVHNDPIMESVLEVLSVIGKHKEITIRGKGKSIPNAIAVALIITEKMMKGNSKIHKITVDSEPVRELGQALSNIEIVLRKI